MALEKGGEAVKTFMDIMKESPIALALCVMNVLLLGYLYYTGVVAHAERQVETKLLYENRSEMAKLLFQCMPPASGQH